MFVCTLIQIRFYTRLSKCCEHTCSLLGGTYIAIHNDPLDMGIVNSQLDHVSIGCFVIISGYGDK